MTREINERANEYFPSDQASLPANASHEAWAPMTTPTEPRSLRAVTLAHLPEVQLTESSPLGRGVNMGPDGQVQFENSKGAVSCPVPESKSYGQFLFFRSTSEERGKSEEISGVCKKAIDQYQKLESADQAYELAAKIPDKQLAKAVAFSIFEKEAERAGVKLIDIAYDEVMSNDFRPIEKLTPEERQQRIEANEKRINYNKARKAEDARAPEEIAPEEARRRQAQLSEYLKDIGVSEDRIKFNSQVYVPLGWDLRQMRGALHPKKEAEQESPAQKSAAGAEHTMKSDGSVTGTPLKAVPEDHVFVRTDVRLPEGKITTEYVSPVSQSASRAGVNLTIPGFSGLPLVGFGGGRWEQGAEPAQEVKTAIGRSLENQMHAEVWGHSQGTRHEAAVESVILRTRGAKEPDVESY